MRVIIEVSSCSDWTYSGLSKALGWEEAYKKANAGVRERKLGKRVQKCLKNTKMKFY